MELCQIAARASKCVRSLSVLLSSIELRFRQRIGSILQCHAECCGALYWLVDVVGCWHAGLLSAFGPVLLRWKEFVASVHMMLLFIGLNWFHAIR